MTKKQQHRMNFFPPETIGKKKEDESCFFHFCFSFSIVVLRNKRFLLQISAIKDRKTKINIFQFGRNFFIRDNNTEKYSWCSFRLFFARGNYLSLGLIELGNSCDMIIGLTNFFRQRFHFWFRIFSKMDILMRFR